MTKKLSLAAALLLGMSGAAHGATDGDWKLYPTYDNYFNQVVVTPSKTYVVALSQLYNASVDQYSTSLGNLFVYDQDGDEYKAYTLRDKLSEVTVSKIAYNEKSKYLFVLYDNGNIDLLYDNGKVKNIPGLKSFTLKTSKAVNDIVFVPEYNEVYLSTAFGYVVIDDNKGVISTSRNFSTSVTTMTRVGDYLYLVSGGDCYMSRADAANLSLSDFTSGVNSTLATATNFLPLTTTNSFAAITSSECMCVTINEDGSVNSISRKTLRSVTKVQRSSQGYVTYSTSQYGFIPYDFDGTQSVSVVTAPSGMTDSYASSWDFKEFWLARPRKGLTSLKYADSAWTVTRDAMSPNAPACYLSIQQNMAYSSKYGVLATNHSVTREYTDQTTRPTNLNLVSGLKDGVWTVYAPAYTNPTYATVQYFPNGMCVDPDNEDYIYTGSRYNGILRLNLANPDDVLHMTHPKDASASLPSYQKICDDDSGWTSYCNFTAPKLDSYGNLWSFKHMATGTPSYLYVWPADKRRAGDVTGWKTLTIFDEITAAYTSDVFPLTYSANKNYVVVSDGKYGGKLYVIDTKGTPTDPSDDVMVTLDQLYDDEGSSISREYIYAVYEDPTTGIVWVGHTGGLFYFTPSKVFSDPMSVGRAKVGRNDGTSTADYLLDGVPVMRITTDNAGNKWFATRGGGVVETNSSCNTVIRQLLSSNSYLPDDAVLDLCYNPSTNSVLLSTVKGYAEYFVPGSSSGTDFDAVKVYPNPVRPDYTGWITIEGLLDNALVKIVNAQGDVVRELGSASGGVIQWDGTNMNNTKVNSGVYFVCMSSSEEGVSDANVAKILVVK